MEESREVHSDENRTLPEKKQKRIVKTPYQVEALENFYDEHKYPTETMKLQLAESIALTEKQISGWFCHRRLKDKKSPNDEAHGHGKQDRSSGVIQDRGSGLRQDSCGSTKQGDYRHCEPKEVESRRFTSEGLLPAELRYEHGSHHSSSMDDTSSGSSSPLDANFLPQNVEGLAMSRYPTQNGTMPIDAKGVKCRTGPSGYLKVKGQVENAAITAVKRQLGRQYREDGPVLGIEFEPLPPGAFETTMRDPVNHPYFVGEPAPLHASGGSRTFQQSNPSRMYGRSNSKSYQTCDMGVTSFKVMHGSNYREKYLDRQFKQMPSITHYSNPLSGMNLPMEMNEDSAGETSIYDIRENFEIRTKRGVGGMRLDSLSSGHPAPYSKKLGSKQTEFPTYDNVMPKLSREHIESKPSSLTLKPGEFLELKDRGLTRKMDEEGKLYEERRVIEEDSELAHSANGMRAAKRIRNDCHQQYARKEATGEAPPLTNKIKRSAAEMPSSFSEDETAETSSSGN